MDVSDVVRSRVDSRGINTIEADANDFEKAREPLI